MLGGYDEALFERLAEAEPRSFWYRARARLITDTVRRYFPHAQALLEVGSGSGGVLLALRDALPSLRLVGAEPARTGAALARTRLPPEIEIVERGFEDLGYENAFDVVGAFDVLEHVTDDENALAALVRATRYGGGVLLLVPQHPRLWSEMDRIAHHVRRYRRDELTAKARRAGLEVAFAGSFMSFLLPAMVVSRVGRRILRRGYDPVAELEPGPLNGIFERVLDVERRLISRGVALPVGASLMLVGRKR